MKPSTAILRKASAALRDVAEGRPVAAVEAKRLADAIAPRARGRKVLPFAPRLPPKPDKKAIRKQRVGDVRPLVEARAGALCECGCRRAFDKSVAGRATWDEFHGRKHISVEETWLIRADCHQRKTENDPSREHWDGLFAAHCARHGYAFRRRFYRQPLRRRA